MSTEFASAGYTAGQLNTMVKLLRAQGGGEDAPERFLRGELLLVSVPTRSSSWREEGSVIYFHVTSDGTTGEDWITRLKGKGFRLDYAKKMLRMPDFKPTNGVTTQVAVLKGMLFEDDDRITKKIRAEADKRKLLKPNTEVACLIREKFTDKDLEAMGLWWIITMHEPITVAGGGPDILGADRYDDGSWLNACSDAPGVRWYRDYGFAFVVSQVSAL